MWRPGSSYLLQNDLRLHFGFEASEKIESLDITWSDGRKKESVKGITQGKIFTIQKGAGVI
jgi:hypothetical protein